MGRRGSRVGLSWVIDGVEGGGGGWWEGDQGLNYVRVVGG